MDSCLHPNPRSLCPLADCCRGGSEHADPMGTTTQLTTACGAPHSVWLRSGPQYQLTTCSKWPQCRWSINPLLWGSHVHFRHHTNLKGLKSSFIACMHFSVFCQRPIPRGVVSRPVALASNCVLQPAQCSCHVNCPVHGWLDDLLPSC